MIAVFIDQINVWAQMTNRPCYGFIVVDKEQMSKNLAQNFFEFIISGSEIQETLSAIKNKQLTNSGNS